MKILIAYPIKITNTNPFVYTLMKGLESIGCDVSWGLDEFWNYSDKYDIVHVQWPDSLFKSWKPTDLEILFLEKHLEEIKKKAKIVYTRHNVTPHYSTNRNKVKCYEIVERNADAIVHMGNYGLEELKVKIKNDYIKHFVISHHTYDAKYDNSTTQKEAREHLNIPQNKFVILTFGAYRDAEEVNMVLHEFKNYKNKHKLLLAPRLRNILINEAQKKLSWRWVKNQLLLLRFKHLDKINMNSDFISDEHLPNYFTAADVVLIQRKVLLNSGNIPMAFFFKKPVIGANIGNMGELLLTTNNIVFDPNIMGDLCQALSKMERNIHLGIGVENYKYALKNMSVVSIAKRYLDVYKTVSDENMCC